MPINEPSAAIDYPPYSVPPSNLPPAQDTPRVTAPSPSSTETYYYVVTPYSGDPSLENAREAVPDAYVRNFEAGASVQLGAFSDSARAEELIQQLESQGIPAEIYRP
jgi:cell division septation protein DedD